MSSWQLATSFLIGRLFACIQLQQGFPVDIVRNTDLLTYLFVLIPSQSWLGRLAVHVKINSKNHCLCYLFIQSSIVNIS